MAKLKCAWRRHFVVNQLWFRRLRCLLASRLEHETMIEDKTLITKFIFLLIHLLKLV